MISLTIAAAGQSPAQDQSARFKEKIRQDMTSIPNYTCLETIERARRAPPLDFIPADTIRLEVSSVAGKELFARPGARHFEHRDLASLVPSGAIANGMFATFARGLFVGDKGGLRYRRGEKLAGHLSVRCDFHLKKQPHRRNLWVTDTLQWRRKAGSLSPRTCAGFSSLLFVASCLLN